VFYSPGFPTPVFRTVEIFKSPISRLLAYRTRILSELSPELKRAFLKAVAETIGETTLRAVAEAIEANDLAAAADAIPWGRVGEAMLRGELPPILRSGLEASGRTSANLLLGDLKLPERAFSFDVTTEGAVSWVRTRAGLFIQDVSQKNLATLRAILEAGVREATSPTDLARLIRDGKLIGLTERDARAVLNFRKRLIRDETRKDAIAELSARYSRRLLNARAEGIARSEIIRAHAEGQRETWRQAKAEGLIGDEAVRRWVAVDPCEICAPMEGETAPVGGFFKGRLEPGEVHPRCECMAVLEPFGKAKAA
jgi:hypothetical protein